MADENLDKQVASTLVTGLQTRREDLTTPAQDESRRLKPPKPKKRRWKVSLPEQEEEDLEEEGEDEEEEEHRPSYGRSKKKEVGKMATEFALIKLDDLESIEFDGEDAQVVVKQGTKFPVFEVEGTEDAGEVAKALLSGLDLLEKQYSGTDEPDDLAKVGPAQVTMEDLHSVVEKLSQVTESIEKFANSPRPRPQLVQPGLEKRLAADTAEQITPEKQALYKSIVGKEGATHDEAMMTVQGWVDTGDIVDGVKNQLRERFLQSEFRP
jgi:hypothetical protein